MAAAEAVRDAVCLVRTRRNRFDLNGKLVSEESQERRERKKENEQVSLHKQTCDLCSVLHRTL